MHFCAGDGLLLLLLLAAPWAAAASQKQQDTSNKQRYWWRMTRPLRSKIVPQAPLGTHVSQSNTAPECRMMVNQDVGECALPAAWVV